MTVVFSKMKILSILSPIRREGDLFYFQCTMLHCLPANFNGIRFATVNGDLQEMVEHQNTESEGLRLDSSWGLRSFSLSHARDKTKNIFLYFFTDLQTYHLSSPI